MSESTTFLTYFLVLGLLTSFISGILLIVAGFEESRRRGIACLLIPFYLVYYSLSRWNTKRTISLAYLGGYLIVIFALGFRFFEPAPSRYLSIEQARTTKATAYVIGKWDAASSYVFDTKDLTFTFTLVDTKGERCLVVYDKGIPNNFENAPQIVVVGKFHDDKFYSTEVLTKCPTKYQSQQKQNRKDKIPQ